MGFSALCIFKIFAAWSSWRSSFCAVVGLDLAEQSKGAFELTGEALAMDADVAKARLCLRKARAMARAASASGWLAWMRLSISVMPSERRLVSTAVARFTRQEVSMRDWTIWVSMAPLGWQSWSKDWNGAGKRRGPRWVGRRFGPLGHDANRSSWSAVYRLRCGGRWISAHSLYSRRLD